MNKRYIKEYVNDINKSYNYNLTSRKKDKIDHIVILNSRGYITDIECVCEISKVLIGD